MKFMFAVMLFTDTEVTSLSQKYSNQWYQKHFVKYNSAFFTPQPSGQEGYSIVIPCSLWQTLEKAYFWNGWMDFLHSKVLWNCPDLKLFDIMDYCPFAHMGLPMGQKLVKSGTSGIQTLHKTCFQKSCTDLFHSKFYGIVKNCCCAASY